MKLKCLWMGFLLLLPQAALMSETLIDIDFSKAAQKMQIKDKGSFSGVLPDGIVPDFPGWNSSEVSSQALSENGRNFLRFDVKKLDNLVLFRLNGPKIEVPGYYQVKIVCRCPDFPLNAHIRIIPQPYMTLDGGDVQICKEWKEQSFILRVENRTLPFSNILPDVSKLGLYLSFKEGTADIASIKLLRSDKETYLVERSVGIERPKESLANLFRNSRFPWLAEALDLYLGLEIAKDGLYLHPLPCSHPFKVYGLHVRGKRLDIVLYGVGRKAEFTLNGKKLGGPIIPWELLLKRNLLKIKMK